MEVYHLHIFTWCAAISCLVRYESLSFINTLLLGEDLSLDMAAATTPYPQYSPDHPSCSSELVAPLMCATISCIVGYGSLSFITPSCWGRTSATNQCSSLPSDEPWAQLHHPQPSHDLSPPPEPETTPVRMVNRATAPPGHICHPQHGSSYNPLPSLQPRPPLLQF